MRKRVFTVVAVVGAASLTLAGAAGARVRSCHPHGGRFDFRNGQEYAANLSVRNITCRQAVHALHTARLTGWPPNLHTPSFHCYIVEGGGGATDGCVPAAPTKPFASASAHEPRR
jgi:hypothetical protein